MMKHLLMISVLIVSLGGFALAQATDTTASPASPSQGKSRNVFYGGTIGLSFGSYFRISVQPMVGYSFSRQFSGGLKFIYEYINDTRYTPKTTWNNYGGSVFGRYRFIPQAYLHAEFAYISYGYAVSNYQSERTWVPFLLLGGGYIQPVGGNASLFVEVLFDVLQDSNSPYDDWTPFISVGVAVGI
jgi:hypothetical protein